MKTGADLIKEERLRQIEVEGYSQEHDKNHRWIEFEWAAIAYLLSGFNDVAAESYWPWEKKYFKPKDKIKNLTRAGALVAAAIDRLQQDKSYV